MKVEFNKIIGIVSITLAVGYMGLYFYVQYHAKRRMADADSISLKYVPTIAHNIETGEETVRYKVPCPEGYTCDKMIPGAMYEEMENNLKAERQYVIDYERCQGDECVAEVGTFLSTYGVKTKVSNYLKDKK